MDGAKRVEELRNSIIKVLPKFPNNKDTKTKLEQMPVATLLIHYLNWRIRYVATRRRMISVESTAKRDPRWSTLQPKIESFLRKVELGKDLTPHLSLQAHSRGYTPMAAAKGRDADRWADKDFLLNVMGYHHFHLGTTIEPRGHVARTDDVLFARVSKEEFNVVGIFTHAVFESAGKGMTGERKRLWHIFDEHVTRGATPGSVVIAPIIAMSGHPLQLVSRAQDYSRVIHEVNPKLDDANFTADLYRDSGWEVPKRPKFEWELNCTDLMVVERSRCHYFVMRRGFN